MARRHGFVFLFGLSVAVIQVCGCGGGSGPPPPPVTFVLFPNAPSSIVAGQMLSLTAVGDSSFGGVSWNLTGPGTLTSRTNTSVTFTSPASVAGSPVQATVTATSLVNSAVSHSATVNIYPAPMFTSTTLPDGNVGTSYSFFPPPVTGAGTGPGNFTFAVTGGTLPPGLTYYPSGSLEGTPGFPVQKYNFTLTVTDTTDGGAFMISANLTINILPPLPLEIGTQPPLPLSGANILYDFAVQASGGIAPYTFSLATGSSPLPAGLNLTTSSICCPNQERGLISGTPTTPGTTNNIIIQVTDAQSPPAVSPGVTYSITVLPSTNFVGTQAPGDVWQVVISHNDPTDGLIMATDLGTSGLPGAKTGMFSENFSTVNAGFRKYFAFLDTDLQPRYSHAVEVQDQMILMQPDAPQVPVLLTQKVVAAVPNTCPQLATTFPTTANYNFVALPTSTFASTDPSFGTLALTQTASNSYSLTFNTFQNDGTPIPSTTFAGVSCDSNLQVLSLTGPSGTPVTVAISADGALIIDNGTGVPNVGVRQPAANLSAAAILGGQYLGVEFVPTANGGLGQSTMVGFGPGSGTSIEGGSYANIDSDSFNAHGADKVLTLANQISPGLFPGSTLDSPQFNVIVGQVKGKFVLFGMSDYALQPYALLLIQQ